MLHTTATRRQMRIPRKQVLVEMEAVERECVEASTVRSEYRIP